jgi:hypothetical protein
VTQGPFLGRVSTIQTTSNYREKSQSSHTIRRHELKHDSATKQPYLGVARLNIHKFDGESLPLDDEQVPESSDEEPTRPRPQSESSSEEELTQRYTPPIETTTTIPTTPGAADAHYRGEP